MSRWPIPNAAAILLTLCVRWVPPAEAAPRGLVQSYSPLRCACRASLAVRDLDPGARRRLVPVLIEQIDRQMRTRTALGQRMPSLQRARESLREHVAVAPAQARDIGRRQLADLDEAIKFTQWDRSHCFSVAHDAALQVACIERMADVTGKPPLAPSDFGLQGKGKLIDAVIGRCFEHAALSPAQSRALSQAVKHVDEAITLMARVPRLRAPVGAVGDRPFVPVLPQWRLGDRWQVETRPLHADNAAPGDPNRFATFTVKGITRRPVSTVYEVGVHVGYRPRSPRDAMGVLFFQSRDDVTIGPSPDVAKPSRRRDLFLIEARLRQAPGSDQWVRQVMRRWADGPFVYVADCDGVRIDWPVLTVEPFLPGQRRLYETGFYSRDVRLIPPWLDSMQTIWRVEADAPPPLGKQLGLRFRLRDHYADDLTREVTQQWYPGAPWWIWSRSDAHVSQLKHAIRVEQSPREVFEAVRSAVAKRDFAPALAHFEETVRRAVAGSDEVAFRVKLANRLEKLKPSRFHRSSLTGLRQARLTLQERLAEAHLLFRLEGHHWRIDRRFLVHDRPHR